MKDTVRSFGKKKRGWQFSQLIIDTVDKNYHKIIVGKVTYL